jgi:LAT3 family solute carrier family 43 protein 3
MSHKMRDDQYRHNDDKKLQCSSNNAQDGKDYMDQHKVEQSDGVSPIPMMDANTIEEPIVDTSTPSSSPEGEEDAKYRYRLGLLIFTALYTTFFAGAFFGWGPMQLLLEEDGAFAWKCTNVEEEDAEPCPDQSKSLLNVHFAATLLMIVTPFAGHLGDTKGPLILMMFVSSMGFLGLALLIVSRAMQVDQLLYVAFSCLSIMAFTSSVMIMHTGMIFDSETARRRVIGLLNNLFDAGSITYLILWEIHEASGASLQTLALGYLGVAVFSFGGSLVFWKLLLVLTPAHMSISLPDDSDEAVSKETTAAEEVSMNNSESKAEKRPTKVEDASKGAAEDEEYILIALRLPWEQLRSTQFLMLAAFFSFHICRNLFTLTSSRNFLAYLGDDDNKYITIFTLMMPLSILGFPFVDCALHKYGYHAGLQLINFLAAVHGTVQVSSSNLNVQVVGFVVFSFYRSFLFSVIFSFLPVFLGRQVLGKANGLLQVSAGFVSFFNIPLGNIAVERLDGNFFVPNLLYTVGIAPCIYAAYCMGQGIRKEEAKKSLLFTGRSASRRLSGSST